MATTIDEISYKITDDVATSVVASDQIDKTFRSTCIGMYSSARPPVHVLVSLLC